MYSEFFPSSALFLVSIFSFCLVFLLFNMETNMFSEFGQVNLVVACDQISELPHLSSYCVIDKYNLLLSYN